MSITTPEVAPWDPLKCHFDGIIKRNGHKIKKVPREWVANNVFKIGSSRCKGCMRCVCEGKDDECRYITVCILSKCNHKPVATV